MIEESKLDIASGGEGTTDVNELEEYKESVARRNNIIIFKAKESDEIEPDQRKTDDIMIVNELCKITGANPESIKNVTRLGKKNEKDQKPRPMKVVFEDEKAKGVLMSNLKILAIADDKFKQLNVAHDMTQREREQNKKTLAEAKEKNEAMDLKGQSEKFIFMVKGPPWDRKVVKVKKND